jgi:hypothetical protein
MPQSGSRLVPPPRQTGQRPYPLSGPLSFYQTATVAPSRPWRFYFVSDFPLLLQDHPAKDIVLLILPLQSLGMIFIRSDCLFDTSVFRIKAQRVLS